MGNQRPGQTSSRRPRKTGPDGDDSGATGRTGGAPAVPPAVRTALARLRDAAAAHDDELPADDLSAVRPSGRGG
ncbi:MAG TPA: hypothetical protein VHU92_16785 [Streptosporangiaceae bacterium]|nr:hypothetical protein [Streptosporangiaceae bacterium]